MDLGYWTIANGVFMCLLILGAVKDVQFAWYGFLSILFIFCFNGLVLALMSKDNLYDAVTNNGSKVPYPRVIPSQIDALYDLSIIVILAGTGHFIAAVCYAIFVFYPSQAHFGNMEKICARFDKENPEPAEESKVEQS